MRDTRVDLSAGLVAAVLVCVAVAFAVWRGPADSGTPDADWHALGRDAYRAECASCHPSVAPLTQVFVSEGGRGYLIGLLLRGEIRSAKDGRATVEEGHPAFDDLPDDRLAAVINHVATGGGDGMVFPEGIAPVTPLDVRARRAGRK